MANRYENGKIYTIRSHMTDKYYIGSSCLPLHKRLYHHKQHYNKWMKEQSNYITSYEILKYDDVYIELLEEYKCNNKMELLKREGELIRQHYNDIVNKNRPNRTIEEKKETSRLFAVKHKDERKKYRDDNKERFKELYSMHSQKKYKCLKCNSEMLNHNKYKHNKTQIHLKNCEILQ
jgi:hypothetical protein